MAEVVLSIYPCCIVVVVKRCPLTVIEHLHWPCALRRGGASKYFIISKSTCSQGSKIKDF